jgi:hypothetical protein
MSKVISISFSGYIIIGALHGIFSPGSFGFNTLPFPFTWYPFNFMVHCILWPLNHLI